MTSVTELKAAIQEANVKAGEAWGAIEHAREQIAAALEAIDTAHGMAAMVYDGSFHEAALSAVSFFSQAKESTFKGYALLGTGQDQLLAGQNNCELFMGGI